MVKAFFVALCLAHIGLATADYACICNYKEPVPVYSKETKLAAPLGNLTGWGCKQVLSLSVAPQWYPVAFHHQVGYVLQDSSILMQMCVGDPPTDDKITPVPSSPTTTPTPATSTAPSSPPTTKNNHHGNIDGNPGLCPAKITRQSSIFHNMAYVGQFGPKCYALSLSESFSWEHTNRICRSYGGNLVQIENEAEQAFVKAFVRQHIGMLAVWLGLNDRDVEGTYNWNGGSADSGYRYWINHPQHYIHEHDDCVILMPDRHGKWDDVNCGSRYNLMCQFNIPDATSIIG